MIPIHILHSIYTTPQSQGHIKATPSSHSISTALLHTHYLLPLSHPTKSPSAKPTSNPINTHTRIQNISNTQTTTSTLYSAAQNTAPSPITIAPAAVNFSAPPALGVALAAADALTPTTPVVVVFRVAGTVMLPVGDKIVVMVAFPETDAVVTRVAAPVTPEVTTPEVATPEVATPDVTTLTTFVTVAEPVVINEVVVAGACTWPSVICETARTVVEADAEAEEKPGLEMPNCEVYWYAPVASSISWMP